MTWKFGAVMLLSASERLCAQPREIVYEILPVSLLDHVHFDETGNRHLTQVELCGTFSAMVTQSEGGIFFPSSRGVVLKLQDIDFRSISSSAYRVTGSGTYFLEANRITASGLPGAQIAELEMQINEFQNIGMVVPELQIGATFPQISVGLVSTTSSDRPNDSFGLTFHAAPKAEDVTMFFRRGDYDGDGESNITDPILVLRFLFQAGDASRCGDAADCNDDGRIDPADVVYVLESLFLGGERVPVPSPLCGLDPTEDQLTCAGPLACVARSHP